MVVNELLNALFEDEKEKYGEERVLKVIEEQLKTLEPRPQEVINLRYSNHSLAEIGEKFKLSPIAIFNIESKGLSLLKRRVRASLKK